MAGNMLQYVFSGVIHPERTSVNIPKRSAEVYSPEGIVEGYVTFEIALSKISLIFKTSKQVEDIYTLKNGLQDFVMLSVDLLGYFLGCGYTVELTQVIEPINERLIIFGVGIDQLSKYKDKLDEMTPIAINHMAQENGVYLRRCLSDLRDAILTPLDTGFYCYRAIETLKQYFANIKNIKKDKPAWEALRNELQLERDDIDCVKVYADPVRHGGIISCSGKERVKIMEITWDIVFKYISLLGSQKKQEE